MGQAMPGAIGFLGVTLDPIDKGLPLGKDFTLFLDPSRGLQLVGLKADATGMVGVGAPILPAYVGGTIYGQMVFNTAGLPAATGGIRIAPR